MVVVLPTEETCDRLTVSVALATHSPSDAAAMPVEIPGIRKCDLG
jgi:hypothetical protein